MRKEDPRYPLSWPFGWKRTPAADRKASGFRETAMRTTTFYNQQTLRQDIKQLKGSKLVSMRTACDRLEDQLERLGASDVIMSTNVELTIYGEPKGGRTNPSDPGAAVYFKLGGHDRTMACDKWATVPENIAAIANHIDALRRIERYGIGTLDQAFAGYTGLPPPSEDNRPAWRKTLGFKPMSTVTPDDVQVNFRALSKAAIGNADRQVELNLARDAAMRELAVT